jgi:hypothetical protein
LYIPFTSGTKPSWGTPDTSSTGHSVTFTADLDPGEFDTANTVFYQKIESGASCGSGSDESFSLPAITTNLSTTHSVAGTITGLDEASTYCLSFIASNDLGQAFVTSWTIVDTPDVTGPSKPAGLSASAVTQTSATINWSPATDNVGVTSYKIYREGQLLAVKTSASADVSTVCGETSHFLVTAYDDAGNESAPSDEFTLRAGACDVPIVTPPPTPAKLCFAPIKPKTISGKNGKKKLSVKLTFKVATDGQSIVLLSKASGTTLTIKVDGKKVTPKKSGVTITAIASSMTVSYRSGKKTKTVKFKTAGVTC